MGHGTIELCIWNIFAFKLILSFDKNNGKYEIQTLICDDSMFVEKLVNCSYVYQEIKIW